MQNAGLDDSQTGIKIAGRNIQNLSYADNTTLMAENKEELKASCLKLRIQKMKIISSSPITSWQIDGEKWKQWQTIFLGSKITVDVDCSREIKRHSLLGKKAMTNLDSVLTSRDICLPTKVCIVKAMIFPVVMYRCESWTIKKAKH